MDIVHRIGVKAPAPKVYDALATIDGLAGWWTERTTGRSKIGGFTMDVLELAPEQRVRWRVKGGRNGLAPTSSSSARGRTTIRS
jgi:uncharacterized protein YndB with AHSA1/START domain